MRHLMTSFLALHWAVLFALLAFTCMGEGADVRDILQTFGPTIATEGAAHLGGAIVMAPLSCALLVVAALFSWALMETVIGEGAASAEHVFKLALAAAGIVFLLISIGGTMQAVRGLLLPCIAQLIALAATYLVILGERLTSVDAATPHSDLHRHAVHAMARSAAHASLLERISGRTNARMFR
jgi:hypothetical protein